MKQLFILISLLFSFTAQATERLEFSLHKLESGQPGPTILVVGGIQGDEPGGFHAASLLVTNYKVTKGNIWIVPNLNFESIISRSRGVHGDMNRKFDAVGQNDPDFQAVERIKELIIDPQVDMVFNLHDGSGFYRPKHTDWLHSPQRWGQSIIIDQEQLDVERFSDVGVLSRQVADKVNGHLLDKEHMYRVKNTKTRQGNKEMAKTLTYFAINNGKSAVGIEASKNLPTHERVYYHLQVVESFLETVGVELERDFKLHPAYVKNTIDNNLQIAFYENKLMLDVTKPRSRINYVPLQKDADLDFSTSNPLVAVTNRGGSYRVNYGNRRLTRLHPQYFEYDTSLESITINADGDLREVPLGSMLQVNKQFEITPQDGYRVNVIGWKKSGVTSEAGHPISKTKISKRFSVDRDGNIFRIEVYKDEKFSGMVLVKFGEPSSDDKLTGKLPKVAGKS